jgi:hypothetical protein
MNLVWLGALSHARAREVLAAAFRNIFRREGEMPELQYAQSVALGEGGQYGTGCYKNIPAGTQRCDLNNWGALQCAKRPPCSAGCIEATDSEHGTASSQYQACFRTFATPELGAEAFLRRLYGGGAGGSNVLSLARQGRYEEAVRAQRATSYFTLDADRYWEAVDGNVDRVAAALHEPRGDHGSVRLIARAREILPYALAIGAAGAAAYYFVPEVRRLARQGRAMVGL